MRAQGDSGRPALVDKRFARPSLLECLDALFHQPGAIVFLLLVPANLLNPRQLAEVRVQHALRAAPDEEEQSFAAPAAGGVADDEAGPFGGGERGLGGPQDQPRALDRRLP